MGLNCRQVDEQTVVPVGIPPLVQHERARGRLEQHPNSCMLSSDSFALSIAVPSPGTL